MDYIITDGKYVGEKAAVPGDTVKTESTVRASENVLYVDMQEFETRIFRLQKAYTNGV